VHRPSELFLRMPALIVDDILITLSNPEFRIAQGGEESQIPSDGLMTRLWKCQPSTAAPRSSYKFSRTPPSPTTRISAGQVAYSFFQACGNIKDSTLWGRVKKSDICVQSKYGSQFMSGSRAHNLSNMWQEKFTVADFEPGGVLMEN